MTKTQFQYYITIRDFIQSKGYFPRFEDIGHAMGVRSVSSVHKVIQRLCDYGYLVKNGKGYALVPDKMHNLSNCSRGHKPIWFIEANCPLCEALSRIPKAC
jgi:Mn-dependent DtxR family transcriptional regulator